MNRSKVPSLLLIALGALAVLIWFRLQDQQEFQDSVPSQIAGRSDTEKGFTQRPVLREQYFRPASDVVTASIVFDHAGHPQPVHPRFSQPAGPVGTTPFPRGVYKERRYHEPTDRVIPEALRTRPAIALAGIPEDGRIILTTEEADVHTLQGIRMGFVSDALEEVLAGNTARLAMPTPEGGMLEAEITSIRDRGGMTHTFQGALSGYREQASVVQLVYHDGILHGSVALYDIGRHFEYRMLADGHMMVRELDPATRHQECRGPEIEPEVELANLTDELAAEGVDLQLDTSMTGEGNSDGGDTPSDTPGYDTVDIVVGYGKSARQSQGGVSQMEALIISSVDRMNTAFSNSLITNTELMLLGTIEDPDYVFKGSTSGSMSDELSDLKSKTDGDLDTVSTYADGLGSDLMAFVIRSADGSAGIANKPGFASITARTYMTSDRITFCHEVGHNLGCDHSWGDSSQSYHFEYGWRLDPPSANRVRTIMAYDWSWGSGDRIPYFGNPDVEYLNARTGQNDQYDVSGDSESDSRYYVDGLNYSNGRSGFDGTNPSLGARNAHLIRDGSTYFQDGAAYASSRKTRTAFAVTSPSASTFLTPGEDLEITWTGGDHLDEVKLELFKGGLLDTTIETAYDVSGNGAYTWTIPGGQSAGTDYMIRVTRNGSETADSGLFAIMANTAPTDIALGDNRIDENEPAGTVVGTFSTVDAEGGPFSYALVSGSGSADNGSFQINGADLESAEVFDFETEDTYTIRVRSTDPGGLSREEAFTVMVDNVNEAPIITVVKPAVPAAVGLPSGVGLILDTTVTDDTAPPSFTWSKVSGDGTLNWDNTDQADTGVTFSQDGDYVLRLTADDGVNTATQDFQITVGASAGGTGGGTSLGPTDGLLVQWSLNDDAGNTVTDTSGNSRDGTLSGASWAAGRFDGGLSYGSNASHQVEDADAGSYLNGLSAISVSVWVNSNATNSDRGVLIASTPSGGDSTVAIRYDRSGASGGGSNVIKAAITSTGGGQQIESASNVQTTDWQHLVLTWESGGTLTLYIDGTATTPTFNSSATSGTLTSNTTLLLGRGGKDANSSWNGLLDELRIYNRVLTQAEITQLGQEAPSNIGPDVEAGSLPGGVISQTQSLDATVTDDGNPTPALTTLWAQRSGSGTVTFGDTGVVDTTVSADAADTYVLRLQADDGAICTFDEFSWTVNAAAPPASPSGLSASAASANSISLVWTDNSGSEEGFLIERATKSGGPWTSVITTAPNTTSHTDSSLAADVFFYQVTATHSTNGNSAPSAEASASTEDSDSDGMIDEFEELAGSNPNDGTDRFELITATPTSGTVAFEVSTATGSHYRVYYRDSLSAGTWQVLTGYEDVTGTGAALEINDSPPSTRFYKIDVQAAPW